MRSITQDISPLARAWPAVLAAAVSMLWGFVSPLVSALLVALLLGIGITNTRLGRNETILASVAGAKTLLRFGVVLLGARLTWEAVSNLGLSGLMVALVTVVAVFTLTCWVGDALKLERGLVTLIATAFSICGAAAIAAVESSIKRRDRDVGVALAMVTIFGTLMIIVIPVVGSAIGLSDLQIGIWAGASIHEVAQVVAAASAVGGAAALAAATTVKLIRVALLAVAVGSARWRHRDERALSDGSKGGIKAYLPWFLVGFVAMSILSITGFIPSEAKPAIDSASTLLLSAGMFGLGLGIRFKTLFPVPFKVVILSMVSTLTAAVVPLSMILLI